MGSSEIIQRRAQAPQGGGRNAPEWVAGINRNQWPECVRIRSRGLNPFICLWNSLFRCKIPLTYLKKL